MSALPPAREFSARISRSVKDQFVGTWRLLSRHLLCAFSSC
jgi:hypothetical protein